jgi:hypothetical protein
MLTDNQLTRYNMLAINYSSVDITIISDVGYKLFLCGHNNHKRSASEYSYIKLSVIKMLS